MSATLSPRSVSHVSREIPWSANILYPLDWMFCPTLCPSPLGTLETYHPLGQISPPLVHVLPFTPAWSGRSFRHPCLALLAFQSRIWTPHSVSSCTSTYRRDLFSTRILLHLEPSPFPLDTLIPVHDLRVYWPPSTSPLLLAASFECSFILQEGALVKVPRPPRCAPFFFPFRCRETGRHRLIVSYDL